MNTYSKIAIALVIVGMLVSLSIYLMPRIVFSPTDSQIPLNTSGTKPPTDQNQQLLIENLSIPWEFVFLDDNQLLITERTGAVLSYDIENRQQRILLETSVKVGGEGGLLGMALHPQFAENNYIYLYETYKPENSPETNNRVVRYLYSDEQLVFDTVIIDNIPGAAYHDGGRIAFGPDNNLYIATGDATREDIAQDLDSLGGKILRLNEDGSVPQNNPFSNSYVYSYGHRNPQGLAWDSQNRLWSTEHGPSGTESGYDELNLIVAGGNYGWPYYAGTQIRKSVTGLRIDHVRPVLTSGPDETWAPASLAIRDDVLYWGGLRGQSVYQATILGDTVQNISRNFFEEYGRIRTVNNHRGLLYLATSNTDGRGFAGPKDDKILQTGL